jgi:hypothetical protein
MQLAWLLQPFVSDKEGWSIETLLKEIGLKKNRSLPDMAERLLFYCKLVYNNHLNLPAPGGTTSR